MKRISPVGVTPIRPIITMAQVALQAELLAVELRDLAQGHTMEQPDVEQLHRLVANCLLFLGAGPKR